MAASVITLTTPNASARRFKLVFLVALTVTAVFLPVQSSHATFSGDNGRIAFRRFLNNDRTWGAVFTIRPNGTGEVQITHPPMGYVDRNPDVSPDGTRIVFERESVDCGSSCFVDDVFVVNADGSHLTRLTGVGSPNGTCLPDGGQCNGMPAWSPDGKQIVFSRASGPVVNDTVQRQALYIMDANGSHITRITQQNLPATGEDTDPQWSPNGEKILFQRRNVRTARPADGVAIWTINLRTGHERRVTPYRLRAGDTPDWSPDGQHILFHDNVDIADRSANLYTIEPDGTHLKQLTFASGGLIQYLGSSYSPDGKWITFGRRPATGGPDADAADVYVMRVNGTDKEKVTHTVLYDSYPDWGPSTNSTH
jgi:Tol biopolymer transport system component